jgi:serine/threonine protein kinase/tetratricopeptide (TPR) repeat protein
MIGKTVSHYRILEPLGEGAVGLVYKAEDLNLKRIVALKFLHPDAVGSEEQKQRFIREAQTAAALDHPSICTVYEIEESGDKLFISMVYIDGSDLKERIDSGPVEIDHALDIAIQVGRGLAAAHAKGIVHRDIKCSNIMITKDGGARITDFGIARIRGGKEISKTTTGAGTPAYMSPEQARGESVDHRTDIWSLGVCLYEMLTGELPFRGDIGAAVVYSILNEGLAAPSEIRPQLPAELDAIISKALAKDLDDRYQRMSDFLAHLENPETALDRGGAIGSPRDGQLYPSIAVLPFEDLSPGKDQEYFCDGIAEEIMNELIQIDGLSVAARTSSFAFKGKHGDIRAIGRKLGVRNLLGGSVRKVGDALRITVQLTDVAGGLSLWSERFDRELKDVFSIQDEIAANVVQALKVKLSAKDERVLAKSATQDYEAYDFYLRGRQFYRQTHRKGISYALEMYDHAIERDPGYAPAYAGMADCYSYVYSFFDDDKANLDEAIALSRKALDLDPELADGHIARGRAFYHDRCYAEAEKEFKEAIRLNPDHPAAYEAYARNSYSSGNLEKAARLFTVAMEKDPENFDSPLLLAQTYKGLGQDDKGAKPFELGLANAKRYLELNPDHARALYMCAIGLANIGDREKAFGVIDRALAIDPEDPMILYGAACVYALTGREEEAIDHLEKALSTGCCHSDWVEKDNDLEALRDHPRFKALLDKLT